LAQLLTIFSTINQAADSKSVDVMYLDFKKPSIQYRMSNYSNYGSCRWALLGHYGIGLDVI